MSEEIREAGSEIKTYEIKIKITKDNPVEAELYDFVDPDNPESDREKIHAGYSFLNFLYAHIRDSISNGSKGDIRWNLISVKEK